MYVYMHACMHVLFLSK